MLQESTVKKNFKQELFLCHGEGSCDINITSAFEIRFT